MKVSVVWFGRPAASPYEGEVERYRRRVQRRWPATDVALRPVAGRRASDPVRALAQEAEAARGHLVQGWLRFVLDEEGERLDSGAFARALAAAEADGTPGVGFVIGSDLGLHASLRAEADRRLSLSRMTFPHLLARLLLWEQLFRATHILGGGGYHRLRVQ